MPLIIFFHLPACAAIVMSGHCLLSRLQQPPLEPPLHQPPPQPLQHRYCNTTTTTAAPPHCSHCQLICLLQGTGGCRVPEQCCRERKIVLTSTHWIWYFRVGSKPSRVNGARRHDLISCCCLSHYLSMVHLSAPVCLSVCLFVC